MHEQNNILSSKVGETQKELNQQQTQNIQAYQSFQSVRTPNRQKKGKRTTTTKPAPSKKLVVLAPKNKPHFPQKVYSDCWHRLMDRREERGELPIRIEA